MLRKVLTAGAIFALGVGTLAAAPSGASPSARASLGSNADWATPSARVGAYDANAQVPFRVYLELRNEAGVDAFDQAVSDPMSPTYHHYMTSAQFHAAYSPTSASVQKIESWLRSYGITIGAVPANNMFVPALGTAAQVERAFSVHLSNYKVQGKIVRGTDAAPTVPTSLAPLVTGVIGVDQSESLFKPLAINDGEVPDAPPPPGFRNAPPCSNSWAQKVATNLPKFGKFGTSIPWTECKKTPPMLRKAYGYAGTVASGIDGRGVKVGIVDAFASPTMLADATEYSKRNDPAHVMKASQYRQIVPQGIFKVPESNPCDPQGWYGEETLDVEAVHAMAPGADIVYSGGKSCQDPAMDAALNTLIDKQLVNMVSNSYGEEGEGLPASEIKAEQQIFKQAGAEGIGLYFSSGDEGDESTPPSNGGLGHPAPDFPASSPLVTAVGGTSMGIAANGTIAVEQAWETTVSELDGKSWDPSYPGQFLYGSGGGTSRHFAEPSYQKSIVPKALAARYGGTDRVVPDVAMLGDPNTGMTVGETQTFPSGVKYDEYRIGGTSLSSPLFTGVMALADQAAGFNHGFANPALYHVSASAFRDVAPGKPTAVLRRNYDNGINASGGYDPPTIRTFDTGGNTIHSAVGYDDETGRGVPRGTAFLQAMRF